MLQVIIDYINENGYPPTFREIGRAMGIGSTKGVSDHLDTIERKGYIMREPGEPRAIKVLKFPGGLPGGTKVVELVDQIIKLRREIGELEIKLDELLPD